MILVPTLHVFHFTNMSQQSTTYKTIPILSTYYHQTLNWRARRFPRYIHSNTSNTTTPKYTLPRRLATLGFDFAFVFALGSCQGKLYCSRDIFKLQAIKFSLGKLPREKSVTLENFSFPRENVMSADIVLEYRLINQLRILHYIRGSNRLLDHIVWPKQICKKMKRRKSKSFYKFRRVSVYAKK